MKLTVEKIQKAEIQASFALGFNIFSDWMELNSEVIDGLSNLCDPIFMHFEHKSSILGF